MNRVLLVIVAVLAIGALVAGDGSRRTPRPASGIDLNAIARDVEAERDHVDAVELAEWIRAQRPHLQVIDVRDAAAFEEEHIPSARNVPVGRIAALPVDNDETIVLYSDGGTHAAQAWFILKAQGVRSVYFLKGGLNEWTDEVMVPMLAAPVTGADSVVYRKRSELSRYFGGHPVSSEAKPARSARRTRGRGLC